MIDPVRIIEDCLPQCDRQSPSHSIADPFMDASAAYEIACQDLLQASSDGHWEGRLASSALSTATAISAFSIVARNAPGDEAAAELRQRIDHGVRWLVQQQNSDGGFGDTDQSYSNISTTMLTIAALRSSETQQQHAALVERAESYVQLKGGVAGLKARYGRDKTFAVPILANAALAQMVNWDEVAALPFEAACLPQAFYRLVRLPVVSYAIPALVAIGQLKFHFDPPRNPATRWLRRASVGRSLAVLRRMQPASGGYLEAIPLTSFVVMALAGSGRQTDSVVQNGLRFLRDSQRDDGSWPIDTNLATWVTSLAISALAAGPTSTQFAWSPNLDWLLSCQNRKRHPFTGAEPGGWGWSDLSGAVPDADDTPAALLALDAMGNRGWIPPAETYRVESAARAGVRWLLRLQNRDGGWPTFCRGWGHLPFDRSGSDLTAHAIRALDRWRQLEPERTNRSIERGFHFLSQQQRSDGTWIPLWFGNQDVAAEENPVYGTCKVLCAYRDLQRLDDSEPQRAISWLMAAQNTDGGWGGGASRQWNDPAVGHSTVEETSLAVEVLADLAENNDLKNVVERGLNWLIRVVSNGYHKVPAPIGFYFAKLWYYENLYPLTFAVAALGRVVARQHGAQFQSGSATKRDPRRKE